jgi:hypothetical protein
MSRWRIEYVAQYRSSPLSYWVHHNKDDDVWLDAHEFDPPLPEAIPEKGFPRLIIDAFGTDLEFASLHEAVHAREVLAQKNMPTSIQLATERGSSKGPNSHWLSRFPASLKPWNKRQKLLRILDQGIAALEQVYYG